jgi:hypothetical protein
MGTFKPSTGTVTQVVELYPTTTTLNSIPNPSQFGQAVTFTAQVTGTGPGPTGKVKLLDGTAGIGLATLNGSGVAKLTESTLAVGTHPITSVARGCLLREEHVLGGEPGGAIAQPAQFP